MIVHAAGESVVDGPAPESTHAVVLMARDEAHLLAEAARLELRGARIVRVVEDQAPFAGQLMALGLPPGRRQDLRRLVSCLPMLR
jgi:hypothetical protein